MRASVVMLMAAGSLAPALGMLDESYYDNCDRIIEDPTTSEVLYNLCWKVEGNELQVGIEAKTTGWVGFGIAEQTSGTMAGSDIVIASIDESGAMSVSDRFATGKYTPVEDCIQDWVAVSGTEADGWTVVELKRALDTNDHEDRPLVAGELKGSLARVIGSFGFADDFSYHASRGHKQVPLLGGPGATSDVLAELKADPNVFTFDLRPETPGSYLDPSFGGTTGFINRDPDAGELGFEQGATVTQYYDICFNWKNQLEAEGFNDSSDWQLVAIEALIDEKSEPFLHHFVGYGFEGSDNCRGRDSMLYAWAPGGYPFVLPSETGFSVGTSTSSKGYSSLQLNIHLDNPTNFEGHIENSGVRIYVTKVARKFEAGVLQLGDGSLALARTGNAALPKGISHVETECPSTCTETFPHDLNVFADQLHMHQTGKAIWSDQYNSESRLLSDPQYSRRASYYDFNFQPKIEQNYVIHRGDAIRTTCWFDTGNDVVNFGLGSSDEMCINFFWYYPKIDLEYCGAELNCGGKVLSKNGDDVEFQNLPDEALAWPGKHDLSCMERQNLAENSAVRVPYNNAVASFCLFTLFYAFAF